MKQKRAIKILAPDHPLRAGTKELIEISLRIPDAVQILESHAKFEGRCRASFSGQDSLHTLIDENLYIPFSAIELATSKGIHVVPEGTHRVPIFLTIPHHLPGTFGGKSGAIAYRIIIKLKVKRFLSEDEGSIECEKVVDVLGRVSLDQQPLFGNPVSLVRHVKKRTFFINRLEANLRMEIDRAAYIVGEHILMSGEISNEHPSNTIKHVGMELRQCVIYASGDAQRSDFRLISKLILGSIAPNSKFSIHHSVQIPFDCYPSLSWNGNPIQVSYELLLTNTGNFEIGIPVFIGNSGSVNTRRSIMYPESNCDQSSVYYCAPPSEFSCRMSEVHPEPPPYSTFRAEPMFIPVHILKTPYRPFAPNYSIPTMFGPPKYDYNDESPQRFLKIEEIVE